MNSVLTSQEILDLARRTLRTEAEALERMADMLDGNFVAVVNSILESRGKVIVTGMGKSGLVGRKIAATLASTGTPSFFLHPGEAFHGDLGMISADDVILALSYSGETDEVLKIVPFIHSNGNLLISMTGNPDSTLAKNSALHLDIGVRQEACILHLAPTTSTTAQIAMGDALAMTLMQVRHFKPRDFAQFHPGGELGRRLLTTAEDVMRTEELPVIPQDMHLGEAIIHVSKGKLGLGVSLEDGKVVGLITDGDIRRAMEKWQADFFNKTVSDIMTREPKLVSPNTKISEIQHIMHTYKIHTVLVVDNDKRLLGIVDSYRASLMN